MTEQLKPTGHQSRQSYMHTAGPDRKGTSIPAELCTPGVYSGKGRLLRWDKQQEAGWECGQGKEGKE